MSNWIVEMVDGVMGRVGGPRWIVGRKYGLGGCTCEYAARLMDLAIVDLDGEV